jgi:hypothetical protein
MRVLSMDIGLRNLALCVMNCEDKTDLKTYSIELWELYNTLDSDDYHCESFQKSGKSCNKKCSMKYKLEDSSFIYTCKTHFPKTITKTSINNFSKKNIKDYLLQDIAKIVLAKIDDIYTSNSELLNSVDNIIIELQPSFNAKMKFTSHIIYGKLVELYKNTTVPIRFVRASQKLKAYTGPEIICHLKGAYAKRKWLSIAYTKFFLENKFNLEQKDVWLHYLNSMKIQADISDCYLMSINSLYGTPPKKQKTNFKKNNLIN